MTHATENFLQIPSHLTLAPTEGETQSAPEIRLLVRGQGTIGFAIAQKAAFTVEVRGDDWGAPAFRWDVDFGAVRLNEHKEGQWQEVWSEPHGLDREPTCPYWFSFDSHNRVLGFGKGEMRKSCELACYGYGPKPEEGPDPYAWLAKAESVAVSASIRGSVDIWRDPVTVEPPMYVVSHDAITMDDMAHGKLTVPANLSPTCQQLYDNVAGKAFVLDTPGFPNFAEAIKRSIANPDGWCHKTLAAKASEFGKSDPLKTYLRITMGQNQGDSPGIPFVMEIWPVAHYSPIHNHGGSDAVIKVLHGAITVDLYPMLSSCHVEPFARAVFEKDDIAWISPRLNQVHKLINLGETEPCITIQCYMYAQDNVTHWPYFDYLNNNEIGHFDPNSDADYLEFKTLMMQEWEAWYQEG